MSEPDSHTLSDPRGPGPPLAGRPVLDYARPGRGGELSPRHYVAAAGAAVVAFVGGWLFMGLIVCCVYADLALALLANFVPSALVAVMVFREALGEFFARGHVHAEGDVTDR